MDADNTPPRSSNGLRPQRALKIGGQRRRLMRRSDLPRSSTTPQLSQRVVAAEPATSAPVDDNATNFAFAPPRAAHADTGGVLKSSKLAMPPAMTGPPEATPTGTTAATDKRKKKAGLFRAFKPKERSESLNDLTVSEPAQLPLSDPTALQTAPLPPGTPGKAAKFFGFRDHVDDTENSPTDEIMPRAAEDTKQAKFKDEDDDQLDPLLPSSAPLKKWNWKAESKKAMNLLDLNALRPTSRGNQGGSEQLASPATESAEPDMSDYGESDQRALLPAAPKRKSRKKKGGKSLDRMSPIREASISTTGAYLSNSGLVAPDEYDDEGEDDDLKEGFDEFSVGCATVPSFSLEGNYNSWSLANPSSLRQSEEEDDPFVTKTEGDSVYRAAYDSEEKSTSYRLPRQGPLQNFEHRLLDKTEDQMRLDAKGPIGTDPGANHLETQQEKLRDLIIANDAQKKEMDEIHAELKKNHEKMKADFHEANQKSVVPEVRNLCNCTNPNCVFAGPEEEGSNPSIRSSIDLDEEPTLHVARQMTITRVTPGMVKLVDIPPRKNKKPTEAATGVSQNTSQPLYPAKPNGKVTAKQYRASIQSNIADDGFDTEHYHPTLPIHTKARVSGAEALHNVESWVNTTNANSASQRPISSRMDPAVLRDRQIPPAPLPKDVPSLPTRSAPGPPPKAPSASKPFEDVANRCAGNVHNFKAIFNDSLIRRDIQMLNGTTAVACPVCHKHVDKEKDSFWYCDKDDCAILACFKCAVKMQKV
ncbi:hypothetical protein BDV95DRAFT_606724 [Massariosphaeria phaeospora]|uniref:Uncharacterized protein n=1 Tax=Massariosphaeria phaeospora TaxID=100035 RepID=A0A7C8MPT4_9PLEO|nr:hypothetical protein BDV95DRAFT_606724 [Massariosphaeria phaeospora]